jgi:isobutyryl-CoA mutase
LRPGVHLLSSALLNPPDIPETASLPATGLRFVTATALFDGHDASINMIRRLLTTKGCEVIHLGHNRSVAEIVTAALQEDAHAIAISSYQGGHTEFFKYVLQQLREKGREDIRVFGGGGGVIIPEEIADLESYGVTRIYSPHDGQYLGLNGMIQEMTAKANHKLSGDFTALLHGLQQGDERALARVITLIEHGEIEAGMLPRSSSHPIPVLGITGTGGAGKSSITDELIHRFRLDEEDSLRIALIAVDPSRRRSGGALLGDRIRLNAVMPPADGRQMIYMRSLAARERGSEISAALPGAIAACKVARFDLIIVETAGIGQGNNAITDVADISLYVMTPEFGAASQLEKIDMLDFADLVAINKFERRGAEDAYRAVCKQIQRNRNAFEQKPDEMPVFGTIAARFNDDGTTALYHAIREELAGKGFRTSPGRLARPVTRTSTKASQLVLPARARYLAEICETVRRYQTRAREQARVARELQDLRGSIVLMQQADEAARAAIPALENELERRRSQFAPDADKLLRDWPAIKASYSGDEYVYVVRGREFRTPMHRTSLSGSKISRVSLPHFHDDGDMLQWLMIENLPGAFPFTAGVFPFKREGEEPARMFAGEGGPKRTNARFRYLSSGQPTARLSTAFDSVTLYGEDPHERPDIWGKVGNSGVSIATLDDMTDLYDGFDLCSPTTSVSMTINGPAPTILAMFLNVAIDQETRKFRDSTGAEPTPEQAHEIRARTLSTVRGTVQADILKEDQGQNTCLFSIDFSLRCMGDIQQYFIDHGVKNFYSVSLSGYHIAEAGANPISQLAFTLANAFTMVEAYLARGMKIDDFAPNLSFFFSNGMDPEYAVLGRVARRIWAVAMRDKYQANARSQMLKYHIQTSGRSLHAQEIQFNDIRTTLQALIAIYDNCNSLHTNAYDEAVTTPTAESVRRALAIQLIINREWGVANNENPNQGSFFLEELTDLVEGAVLAEFERISERGGVLGAMETGYQRGKIQDESLYYEKLKHSGELPLIGVNTFRDPEARSPETTTMAISRSSEEEKAEQIRRLREFQTRHAAEASAMLAKLKETVLAGENTFATLMEAVRCCSLGQITNALFEVGGRYRRNV